MPSGVAAMISATVPSSGIGVGRQIVDHVEGGDAVEHFGMGGAAAARARRAALAAAPVRTMVMAGAPVSAEETAADRPRQ